MSKKLNFSFPIYIIAFYFILEGIGVILGTIAYTAYSIQPLYNFLNNFRFLYDVLPGAQSNDPFIAAVIQTIRIYNDLFIYLKEIFMIVIFLLTGFLLLKRRKSGFYLALFITISGLILGTTYGLRHSFEEYLQNIFGGFMDYNTFDLTWTMVRVSFLITLFTPFYLILNRKRFKN